MRSNLSAVLALLVQAIAWEQTQLPKTLLPARVWAFIRHTPRASLSPNLQSRFADHSGDQIKVQACHPLYHDPLSKTKISHQASRALTRVLQMGDYEMTMLWFHGPKFLPNAFSPSPQMQILLDYKFSLPFSGGRLPSDGGKMLLQPITKWCSKEKGGGGENTGERKAKGEVGFHRESLFPTAYLLPVSRPSCQPPQLSQKMLSPLLLSLPPLVSFLLAIWSEKMSGRGRQNSFIKTDQNACRLQAPLPSFPSQSPVQQGYPASSCAATNPDHAFHAQVTFCSPPHGHSPALLTRQNNAPTSSHAETARWEQEQPGNKMPL